MSDQDRRYSGVGALGGQCSAGSDEINLRELLCKLWARKWIVLGVSLLAGVIAIFITLLMPDIYQSDVLLAPADESGGGALVGQFGGLASLAGVSLGKIESNKVTIGLEVLKSRSFITTFIDQRDILVPLMAGKEWDPEAGRLLLDSDKYDSENKRWIEKESKLKEGKPSDWLAYKTLSGMLKVTQAKDTGLITLSIRHISPFQAQQWIIWLVEDINSQLRSRDIDEANRSIDYLKLQLEKTPVAGMQQIFYQLIEKQMQTIMLASVRDQYVFKVIDPPIVPEEKVGPKRSLIVLLSVFFGMMFSAACVLFSAVFRYEKRHNEKEI